MLFANLWAPTAANCSARPLALLLKGSPAPCDCLPQPNGAPPKTRSA